MSPPSHKHKRSYLVLFTACLLFSIALLSSCLEAKNEGQNISENSLELNPELDQKPNILWIVAEDMSSYLPSFGDSTIVTPHLSKLAAEGVCYDNFFSPHPVCAPARAAITTGMYANAIGASHMRTGPWYNGSASKQTLLNYQKAMPQGIKPYEAIPPVQVKMFTEYLRRQGYYCSNNSKEDYQFVKTPTAWDESSTKAHWRNRAPGQPFFSVFNIGVTHESQIWKKKNDSLWVSAKLDVPVPPYLPDTDIAKEDIRRMYSNIKEMDQKVGSILKELEDDGLLENTIVIWYTDHGGPLPRQKRMLYDSGIKVPLIIRFPGAQFSGERDHNLISFIDLAPSMLSLASIAVPSYMQGQAFLGKYKSSVASPYVYAAADRFDETTDHVRSVRDKRFKYIRYYQPEKPMYLEVAYRNQMPIMQELLRLKTEGNLDKNQALWFRDKKPKEELFDILTDPYELHDLSKDPNYTSQLEKMRQICQTWVEDINDTGLMAEEKLLSTMIPNGQQPQTQQVIVQEKDGTIQLSSKTQGASIGYKTVRDSVGHKKLPWKIYDAPIQLDSNQKLLTIAHRIGYQPSKITQHQ